MKKLRKIISQKFDYDVSDLSAYIDEPSPEIIPALIESTRTMALLGSSQLMDGVKHKEKIKLSESEITLQSAADCGFNPIGGFVLTDVEMEVKPIKSDVEYCSEKLVGNWGQLGLPNGVMRQRGQLMFEDEIVASKIKQIAILNERLMWIGDTDSVNVNLNKINGFNKKFRADSDVENVNTAGITAFDDDKLIAAMFDLRDALGADVRDMAHGVMVGKTLFDDYKRAIFNKNLYHHAASSDENSFEIPSTNTRVYYIPGLNTISDAMFAGPLNKMFIGTDNESDFSQFSIEYSNDKDAVLEKIKYRLGVQYVFGKEFKKFILAAS
jgi:hypothetical protein